MILTRAGDAYRSIRDFDKAIDYYQRALNIEFDTYAVLGLAIVAKAQARYDEAIESLKRLIQQDVRNHRLYIELADCWLKKNDRREAKEVLEAFQRQGVRNNSVNEMMDRLRG